MTTDSNVLRLIRRYDPNGLNETSIKSHRSFDHGRLGWQSAASKSVSSKPSEASSSVLSFLPQRVSMSAHDEHESIKPSTTSRLQRQKAIHEQDPMPQAPSSILSNSIRPILKYALSSPRAEFNGPSDKTEPLTIEIEPHTPAPTGMTYDNGTAYQPLITTGTKRVCAAISKSEWDLRLQHDSPYPMQPQSSLSTPSRPILNQMHQEKVSYRPLMSRSKSSAGISNINEEEDDDVDADDFDEKSAPVTTGSSIDKLKKIFAAKSLLDITNAPISDQQHRLSSIDSNLNRRLHSHEPNVNSTDLLSSTSSIAQKSSFSTAPEIQSFKTEHDGLPKAAAAIQDIAPMSSPLLKKSLFRSQRALTR